MAVIKSTAPAQGGRIYSGDMVPGDVWEISFNTGLGGAKGFLQTVEWYAAPFAKPWQLFGLDGTLIMSGGPSYNAGFSSWVNTYSAVYGKPAGVLKTNPNPDVSPTLDPNAQYVFKVTVPTDAEASAGVSYGMAADFGPSMTEWHHNPVVGVPQSPLPAVTVPPAASITDSSGNVWTLSTVATIFGVEVLLNNSNAQAAWGSGTEIQWKNGHIYVLNNQGNWYYWTDNAAAPWAATSAP